MVKYERYHLLLKYLAAATAKFIFILFPETVTNWEEVPATLLVHVPNKRFLTSVFCVGFVDQMHQEEHVIGQIVFLRHMGIEPMWHFVEIVLANTTNKAIGLHVLFYTLKLITKLTKSINDQTCNNLNTYLIILGSDMDMQ